MGKATTHTSTSMCGSMGICSLRSLETIMINRIEYDLASLNRLLTVMIQVFSSEVSIPFLIPLSWTRPTGYSSSTTESSENPTRVLSWVSLHLVVSLKPNSLKPNWLVRLMPPCTNATSPYRRERCLDDAECQILTFKTRELSNRNGSCFHQWKNPCKGELVGQTGRIGEVAVERCCGFRSCGRYTDRFLKARETRVGVVRVRWNSSSWRAHCRIMSYMCEYSETACMKEASCCWEERKLPWVKGVEAEGLPVQSESDWWERVHMDRVSSSILGTACSGALPC